MTSPTAPLPGADFLARVTVATWLLAPPNGLPSPILLVTHPEPQEQEGSAGIDSGMRAIAAGLGLTPPNECVTTSGSPLVMRRDAVALDYGHDDYLLRVPPPGAQWRRAAQAAGVGITLGLDPLPAGSSQWQTEAYLYRATQAGRVLIGVTGVRTGPGGAGPAVPCCAPFIL
ncbi:hypothetical protein [Streptomyces sp. bgisy100]|uniref:hypothetical protein n=1 Tax=Streptomyces sp. bgisy100 TaxID=3413783 RepID=UPI003D7118A4